MHVLEDLGSIEPARPLLALPDSCNAIWLDTSGGSGHSLLAWMPDRVAEGAAGKAAGKSPGTSSQDPAQHLADAAAEENWVSEAGEQAPVGWIGWFGYECGHAYERYPWVQREPLGFPDYSFARYRRGVVWDVSGQARLLWAEPMDGRGHARERDEVRAEFQRLLNARVTTNEGALAALPRPVNAPEVFKQGVEELRRRIAAGDLFQANLSQRFECAAPADPRALYLKVRRAQPTAYSAYWQDGKGRALLSWSPECFLSVRGESVETRPIKGTAARSGDVAADAAAVAALEASEKERAELTMIVDMARNDLGRVAPAGGVKVVSVGSVETFPTLFHRVGSVRARWDPRVGLAGLMRATFPPASVTGAPKVAALRAIAELEGEARGPYCGALGYWLPGEPRGEFSVLIRTALVAGGRLSFRAGAGIVWDSDPQREWEEVLLKAAFLRAGLADPQPT